MPAKCNTQGITVRFPKNHWIHDMQNRSEYIREAVEMRHEMEQVRRELKEIKSLILNIGQVSQVEKQEETIPDKTASNVEAFLNL